MRTVRAFTGCGGVLDGEYLREDVDSWEGPLLEKREKWGTRHLNVTSWFPRRTAAELHTDSFSEKM